MKGFLIGVILLAVVAVGIPMFWALGYIGEAATVAREEFGPRELLRKYEWFKDTAAGLDKLKADIGVYEARMEGQNEDYAGKPVSEWPRDAREQRSLWRQEVAGVISRFNDLAADYNAQMSKLNWRFTNAGDLPEGASDPLPREFRSYRSN